MHLPPSRPVAPTPRPNTAFVLLVGAALLAASPRLPAAPRVETTLSSRFLVRGEQGLLQVSIIDGKPDSVPTPPSVPGLTILRTEFPQPDVRMLPGRQTAYDFTYHVFSYEPGRHQVPSFDVAVDGTVLPSAAVSFEVLSPDDLHWLDATCGQRKVRIAANFRTTKDKPFEGETVPVELKVYAPADLRVQDWGIPDFGRNKLAVWRFEPNRLLGRATLNAKSYSSVSYPSTLTATKAGATALGPATVTINVVETAMGAFGIDQFYAKVNLSIPELPVEARPLPPGAPPGFKNAVGQFTLDASVDENEIREGDPVSITLTVSGTGNLDALTAAPPAPVASEGWKIYETATAQRGDERRADSGTVVFRQFMRPLTPQTKVPPFRLVYFDPDREQYRSLVTEPISLKILPSLRPAETAAQVPPALPLPVERMTDILGLLPVLDPNPAARLPWHRLWHLLPACILVFLLLAIGRRHLLPRLRPDPVRSARRRALARFEQHAPKDHRAFLRAAGNFIERWLGTAVSDHPELAAVIEERDQTCFRPEPANPPSESKRRREIMRAIRRHALLVALASLAWLAAVPPLHADLPAAAKESAGETDPAAAAYQDGRWHDAIGLWLTETPWPDIDANRLYNIGNAFYRAGSPGKAALWWRRAVERDASHQEARQNLRFLERKFGSITVQRPAYQHALARLPLSAWQSLVWAAAWLVALAVLAFPATAPGARSRLAAVIALVFAPVIAAVGALAWRHYPDDATFAPPAQQAVITADRAVLYTDASRSSTEVIDAPPGSLCRIVADRGRWLYVSFATRTAGWIPSGDAERLIPLSAPVPPSPPSKPKPASGST